MTDEKGLRFETGLMVILVLFVVVIGVLLAFQSLNARMNTLNKRIDRIEQVIFKEATPRARGPQKNLGTL